jgi:hypothetical protein
MGREITGIFMRGASEVSIWWKILQAKKSWTPQESPWKRSTKFPRIFQLIFSFLKKNKAGNFPINFIISLKNNLRKENFSNYKARKLNFKSLFSLIIKMELFSFLIIYNKIMKIENVNHNRKLTWGCIWHLISLVDVLSDLLSAASFDLIVWSFVIFRRWWAWTQLSQINSEHSTHQDVAGLSSLQLLHLTVSSALLLLPLPPDPSSVCVKLINSIKNWFSMM